MGKWSLRWDVVLHSRPTHRLKVLSVVQNRCIPHFSMTSPGKDLPEIPSDISLMYVQPSPLSVVSSSQCPSTGPTVCSPLYGALVASKRKLFC